MTTVGDNLHGLGPDRSGEAVRDQSYQGAFDKAVGQGWFGPNLVGILGDAGAYLVGEVDRLGQIAAGGVVVGSTAENLKFVGEIRNRIVVVAAAVAAVAVRLW